MIRTMGEDYPTFKEMYVVASEIHKDQKRSNGKEYMTHVDEVIINTLEFCMREFFSDEETDLYLTVAAMHDTVEDHPDKISLDSIRRKLEEMKVYCERIDRIIHGIDSITKKPKGQEPYHEYVKRVLSSRIATRVKIADLTHNMSDLKPGNMLDKYHLTKWILTQ